MLIYLNIKINFPLFIYNKNIKLTKFYVYNKYLLNT